MRCLYLYIDESFKKKCWVDWNGNANLYEYMSVWASVGRINSLKKYKREQDAQGRLAQHFSQMFYHILSTSLPSSMQSALASHNPLPI